VQENKEEIQNQKQNKQENKEIGLMEFFFKD
jgi:hypothetical protein